MCSRRITAALWNASCGTMSASPGHRCVYSGGAKATSLGLEALRNNLWCEDGLKLKLLTLLVYKAPLQGMRMLPHQSGTVTTTSMPNTHEL